MIIVMVFQSWRLCGVTATIVVYIGGVLFLTMNNVPGSHPKRVRFEHFAEFSNYRSQRVSGLNRKMTIRWCKELKYMQSELPVDTTTSEYNTPYQVEPRIQMGLTALASFPGSGNTWLRYLLQQSTGILTGSIYKDYGLLKTGFPAENVCNNSVLLVKTHEWGPKAWALFSKALLLVRDPEKAILAEFNRQSGGHVGFASPDRYKRTRGKYWQQFVANKLHGWELMNINWARNFTGNIKIIFYEDLVNKLEPVLRNILEFLEFPINEEFYRNMKVGGRNENGSSTVFARFQKPASELGVIRSETYT
ncbi:WSCD family member CG9164 isoform X2 [Glossina fuscipes]|uniref:WSCD family member CG9164 isoform X2 n=1 Tax=Glossina fuscipes TaxID=7396 RepID=A0A9C6DSQ8_9MUSC|nr:WSCD family member CG9164 isoform X2 [Glossina fuscipes]